MIAQNWLKVFESRYFRHDKRCISNKRIAYRNNENKCTMNLTLKEGIELQDTSCPKDDHHKPPKLVMDHQKLSFPDYLWAMVFIGPNSNFNWMTGLLKLKLKEKFHENSLKNKILIQHFDYDKLLANFLLEGMLVTHFKSINLEEKIVEFEFRNVPFVDQKVAGKLDYLEFLEIEICLESRKVRKCRCGIQGQDNVDKPHEIKLTSSQALTILSFQTMSKAHVQLHAYGNWGTNPYSQNPFIKRMSKITILYNHFGAISFGKIMNVIHKFGYTSINFNGILYEVGKLIAQNCYIYNPHSQNEIQKLQKYSKIVNFVLKIRKKFFKEFEKYKNDAFMGIDRQAMFTSTILHSLDHYLCSKYLPDPLLLDKNDVLFGKTAELCRIVRAGFVEKPPGFYFAHTYKRGGHEFYREIYEAGKDIDVELADEMDACIIR